MAAMWLGDATVGELDTASKATADRIGHIQFLSLHLYCLRFEIMAQKMTPGSFVKRLANLCLFD